MNPVPPPESPGQRARRQIDAMRVASGWDVQDRAAMEFAAAPGVAIGELQTRAGPADDLLSLGNRLVGVVEAQRAGKTLADVEAQTRDHAAQAPRPLHVPVRPLPFLCESTGVETFFANGRDPDPSARRVFSAHRPDALRARLDAKLDRRAHKPGAPAAPTAKGRMRLAPALNVAGMWPAPIRAGQNLEESVRDGRPRALVQRATGSGTTFTAIWVRLNFDDGRKLTERHNAVNLTHDQVDPVAKVVITTIQRPHSILRGEASFDEEPEEGSAFTAQGSALVREPPPGAYNDRLPPEFYDVVVVDECHRSIGSLWRKVLECFDASLVGLTATPAKHTYAFVHTSVVSEHAVRDRVNVPSQVYESRTRVGDGGATIVAEPDTVVGKRGCATRQTRGEALDEDVAYTASQIDRSVVVPDPIRTVPRELRARMFTDIFHGRTEVPRTRIVARSDDHAEDVLRVVREAWPLSNEGAVKITYRPGDLVAGILDRTDPDVKDARARAMDGLPEGAPVSPEQLAAAQAVLRDEASAPIATQAKLREALLDVRRAREVPIDVVTVDEVSRADARADLALDDDADRALVSAFEAFCMEHRDELDAPTVLYDRPCAQRLTRKQLTGLVAAIRRPPRQMTDLIRLARHATGVEPELVSCADQAAARDENGLAQQANRGPTFTVEQLARLGRIRDRLVVGLEVRMESFDEPAFVEKGGLGKVWGLFGEDSEGMVDALNRELVA